jgi:hypothetical protein
MFGMMWQLLYHQTLDGKFSILCLTYLSLHHLIFSLNNLSPLLFLRTLTANSKGGSDHGWSGNTFMLGGSINGGHILGTYPNDLTRDSPLDVGKFHLKQNM